MTRRKTTAEFIADAIEVHGSYYDYSRVEYITNKVKVEIGCPSCGRWFWQRAVNHLRGGGCDSCGYDRAMIKNSLTTEEFSERATIKHNGLYDYSRVKYVNSRTKVEIGCPLCESWFWQRACSHLMGHGCPSHKSRAEVQIVVALNRAEIPHDRHYGEGLPWNMHLDFYFEWCDLAIEIDGVFHRKDIYGDGKLEHKQRLDAFKTQWCIDQGIELIRLEYHSPDWQPVVSEVMELILRRWYC